MNVTERYRTTFPDAVVARLAALVADHRDLYGNEPCWIWPLSKDRGGYGQVAYWDEGRRANAKPHRVAWVASGRALPEHLTIDHMCRTPACFNVSHLRLLTLPENSRAAVRIPKTHCIHGHEFTPENTGQGIRPTFRNCRACKAATQRRYKARKRAEVAAQALEAAS